MAGKSKKIKVQGNEITILTSKEQDFISLTDMVRNIENGLALIEKWLRNKNTIEFLGIWEEIYNPDFNSPEFEGIKNQAGLSRFVLNDGLSQDVRLERLNKIAISQMKILTGDSGMKRLEGKE
jgi:KilA-N domain